MTLDELTSLCENTLVSHLGITFKRFDSESSSLWGEMPVSEHTVRPYGYLHGGAICCLAETLASSLGLLLTKTPPMGLSLDAHYIRSVMAPEVVTAKAFALHLGRQTQLFEVLVYNSKEQLVAHLHLRAIIEKDLKL